MAVSVVLDTSLEKVTDVRETCILEGVDSLKTVPFPEMSATVTVFIVRRVELISIPMLAMLELVKLVFRMSSSAKLSASIQSAAVLSRNSQEYRLRVLPSAVSIAFRPCKFWNLRVLKVA
jgi:hypothetical protein